MIAVAGVASKVGTMDPLVLLLRASLVVLLVNSNDDVVVMAAVAVVCAVALPRRPMLLSPWLWTALFVGIGARQLATWHTIDDHIVVTTYWCGSISLALRARDPLATLALSARLLVAALFTFAAGWKLFSGQFVDGTFFRYSLLFDERFEVVGRLVGGTADPVREANVAAVSALLAGTGAHEVMLQEGARGPALARVMTWWGLMIEITVAAVHLLPIPQRWSWARHGALIGFAVTTYLVIPVGGFGALLLVLGVAQAASMRGRTAYLGGVGVLLAWGTVWPAIFLR